MHDKIDDILDLLDLINPGGLLIVHVKEVEEETTALLDALKNKSTFLKELQGKMGDEDA